MAFPSAIQNELGGGDAKMLIKNGCKYVLETSNMGCTPEAISAIQEAGLAFGPGKAVNAGGVAVSGLEMSQNSMKLSWTDKEVDAKLHQIMKSIHATGVLYGRRDNGKIDYVRGSNVGGFIKVADAMLDQGY
jgi:glutamate dehydrogenase (NADP+)